MMTTHAFIDASNLFYGGEKSLGWKIDYQKLLLYLKEKYGVSCVYYFGGVETHEFEYDYLNEETVPLDKLEKHLTKIINAEQPKFNNVKLVLLSSHLQKVRFYKKLSHFGYHLFLKPIKFYENENGSTRRKANCDVDMAYNLMKEKENFDRAIILSGDGDFLPVLKHLREIGKQVLILARGPRTAKEIRQFAGTNFRDFEYLRELLKMI